MLELLALGEFRVDYRGGRAIVENGVALDAVHGHRQDDVALRPALERDGHGWTRRGRWRRARAGGAGKRKCGNEPEKFHSVPRNALLFAMSGRENWAKIWAERLRLQECGG